MNLSIVRFLCIYNGKIIEPSLSVSSISFYDESHGEIHRPRNMRCNPSEIA
ncbi:unnamed protein product [Brassica rapa subsp. narinosa]